MARQKGAFINNLKYFFKYQIKVPFVVIYNFFYFMKYPFWQPRNVWTGKKYWTFTEYNQISPGWRAAFGKQLTKDLKEALKKSKQLKTFYFLEIKEKWGALCLYNTGGSEEVNKVITYYERLSICYCEDCGKPARYTRLGGWVGYICADCFNKSLEKYPGELTFAQKYKLKAEHRLKIKDIPVYKTCVDGVMKVIDPGINYRKLWGLNNRRANLNVSRRKEIQE